MKKRFKGSKYCLELFIRDKKEETEYVLKIDGQNFDNIYAFKGALDFSMAKNYIIGEINGTPAEESGRKDLLLQHLQNLWKDWWCQT